MFRKLAPYLLLFLLTAPNDTKFWIAGEDIGVIIPSQECIDTGGQNEIRTATGTYCVKEDAADIMEKIKKDTAEAPAAAEEEEPEKK
jgi:hypothetical protein